MSSTGTALAETPQQPGVRVTKVHLYQRRVLASRKHITVFPGGRRIGKTQVASLWIFDRAVEAVKQGISGLIWCAFPQYDHAARAWEALFANAPRGWITGRIGTVNQPGNITLLDRVRVEFKSAQRPESLVGAGVLALWVDEAGTVAERAWKESLRPTLIDRHAPALLTGTPKGVGHWFHEEYAKGWTEEGRKTHESIGMSVFQGIPSYANPFIPAENFDIEAAAMSEFVRSQEILALFLSDAGAVFKLERVLSKGLGLSERRTVAMGVDLARSNDFTVIVGMDRKQRVTYYERFTGVDWPLQRQKIRAAWVKLGRPVVILDASGVGSPVSEELSREGLPHIPFVFTEKSKTPLIERLIIAFDQGDLALPNEPDLLSELRQFTRKQMPSGYIRYCAPEGADKHDDTVMALALALYGCQRYSDTGVSL